MSLNKKHKDSVFSFLFGNHDALLELYSAIEGVSLPPDTPIGINTLSDVLFMEQINDLSFTIDNRLIVLIEHQSTINRNMPLRLLLYIARVYEKIIERKKLYQTKLEKIPAPEFIVLYNGKARCPDRKTLKLSEAFKNTDNLKTNTSFPLELTAQVYNVNYGHNSEILKKSGTLKGYSIFVENIRKYEKKLPREEAMKAAIKHCIEHNVLEQFLKANSSEVFNMLLTEWDTEEAKEVWFEEGREEGVEEGIEQSRVEIARNALAKGINIDLVHEITGLDIETIEEIKAAALV